jgi:hypothetical protein
MAVMHIQPSTCGSGLGLGTLVSPESAHSPFSSTGPSVTKASSSYQNTLAGQFLLCNCLASYLQPQGPRGFAIRVYNVTHGRKGGESASVTAHTPLTPEDD